MAKKHDLRVNKGKFEFKGNICNRDSERFAHNVVFDSGAEKNEANIGIQTSALNQVYAKVEGFVMDKAKFSKWDKVEKKNYTQETDWEDRFTAELEEGYQPFFGVRVKTEHDGETTSLFAYDAVDQLKELEGGQGVFVRGGLDFSSYKKDNGEVVKRLDFKANGVFAQKEPFVFEGEGFDADKFDEANKFEQEIIYMGLEKHPEDGEKFILNAYVVTYNGVESVEFIVEQKKLATLLKKNLKPYTMINVMGRLYNRLDESQAEDSSDDEAWGDDSDMGGTYIPRIKELVVTKAFPDTIDTESYTEAKINAVLKTDEDFGDDIVSESDDDDEIWG